MATLKVQVGTGISPAPVEVPESEFPETTGIERRRFTVSQDSQCVSFVISQQFSTSRTEIYALEYDVRSYGPDAEGT